MDSLYKLLAFIESENYKGYDPYDILTGWVPFHWFGKWGPILAIQIQKRNPLNIRPLLGVKKDYNPKAMGLFLHAYTTLYQKTNNPRYAEKATFLFNWLTTNYTKGFSGMAWGYNFPWANPENYLKPFVPSAVVTGFVCRGIYEYYQINPLEKVKEIIQSAANFIRHDLERTEDGTGQCISYTPTKKNICFNASLLGAEVLTINYLLNGNMEDAQIAKQAVSFVIHRQKSSGLWAYSINDQGKERIQTDFHQGYVIETIYRIIQFFDKKPWGNAWPEEKTKWLSSIKNGCRYYYENQFEPNGRSYWRLPRKWPVEIHNQSQGIITFLGMKEICQEYYHFAKTIADWTRINMQDPNKGFFYYQKFKTHTNKIPYMRWSQAWMLLALAKLLSSEVN